MTDVVNIVTIGETMVMMSAIYEGELDEKGKHELHVAGAESNVAVDITRLGIPGLQTTWVSRLGDDDAADFVLRELSGKTNVVAPKIKGEKTGRYYANNVRAPDGSLTSVPTYDRKGSAASKLRFSDVERAINAANWLHVTGITPALSDSCLETILRAVRHAYALSKPVSLDVNYRRQLWKPEEAAAVIGTMAIYSSIVKVGLDEADELWGEKTPEGHADFFALLSGGIAIVTLGEQGAMAKYGSHRARARGYKINVIDPRGAGDAFMAGFLATFLNKTTWAEFGQMRKNGVRQKLLEDCLAVANVCGALTCTKRGDTEAMPTMEQVNEFRKVYSRPDKPV